MIVITYVENVTVIKATLNNFSIELLTKDNKTFVFVPDEDLEDGTYTLSIPVVDEDGNSRTDNATYVVKISKVLHHGRLFQYLYLLLL